MKIGLFGGTFDPVHAGHLKLAVAARRELKLSCVYLLVSRNPFKPKQSKQFDSLRVARLRRVLRGRRGFHVSTWELNKKGPSFTADTVRYFKRRYPAAELFFIIGSDSLKTFKRWKSPRVIVKHAQLVVGRRPGFVRELPVSIYGQKIIYLKANFPRVSSTELRNEAH
jgi:nicotinate-nucleotide adenylyltransferase